MLEHLDMLYSYNIYPGQKLKGRINIEVRMLIAVVKYLYKHTYLKVIIKQIKS